MEFLNVPDQLAVGPQALLLQQGKVPPFPCLPPMPRHPVAGASVFVGLVSDGIHRDRRRDRRWILLKPEPRIAHLLREAESGVDRVRRIKKSAAQLHKIMADREGAVPREFLRRAIAQGLLDPLFAALSGEAGHLTRICALRSQHLGRFLRYVAIAVDSETPREPPTRPEAAAFNHRPPRQFGPRAPFARADTWNTLSSEIHTPTEVVDAVVAFPMGPLAPHVNPSLIRFSRTAQPRRCAPLSGKNVGWQECASSRPPASDSRAAPARRRAWRRFGTSRNNGVWSRHRAP